MIHGENEAKKWKRTSNTLFSGKGSLNNIPTSKLEDRIITILDTIIKYNMSHSKEQLRTLIITLSSSLAISVYSLVLFVCESFLFSPVRIAIDTTLIK